MKLCVYQIMRICIKYAGSTHPNIVLGNIALGNYFKKHFTALYDRLLYFVKNIFLRIQFLDGILNGVIAP